MANHVVSYQSPRPEVVIWKPDKSGKPLRFDTSNLTVLQGYSFGTSINDEKGRFTLTFYSDDDKLPTGEDAIFDQIEIMDVVEIYETRNHFRQGEITGYNEEKIIRKRSTGVFDLGKMPANTSKYGQEYIDGKIKDVIYTKTEIRDPDTVFPTFIGVIREKKFVAQKTDNGINRKVTVSGHSIVGLVHEFKINLDMNAMLLTQEIANNEQIGKEFTQKFIQTDWEPLDVSYVIKEIWKSFVDLSKRYEKDTTPEILKYIEKWIGNEDVLFNVDDTTIHYPLASIFRGETTKTFYDVISGIIPQPVYEIFPYTDYKAETMRLKIREVPFDDDVWKDIEPIEIDPKMLKSFDLKQHDKEVYTVFFAYLRGSAIQEDFAIRLATQGVGAAPELLDDPEKYGKYGYRPLFVNFIGYGKPDGKEDSETSDKLKKINERLMNWYSHKDEMFSGTITMETNLSRDMPQAGEKVSFLGGQFYVVDSEHGWNYGGAPETRLTIDRGGDYDKETGKFSKLKDITRRYQELKRLENAG